MDIRTQIWYDLVHAKCGDEYLVLYISRQKRFRKYFKILTIIFSTSGALGWKIWVPIAPIACALIAIVQLLSSIESYLIHTEKQILDLEELRLLYYTRANDLQRLWYDLESNLMTETEAKNSFFDLRTTAVKIESLDNKLDVKNVNSLYISSDKKTREYLNQYLSI